MNKRYQAEFVIEAKLRPGRIHNSLIRKTRWGMSCLGVFQCFDIPS